MPNFAQFCGKGLGLFRKGGGKGSFETYDADSPKNEKYYWSDGSEAFAD
jgi:hypothetical protein